MQVCIQNRFTHEEFSLNFPGNFRLEIDQETNLIFLVRTTCPISPLPLPAEKKEMNICAPKNAPCLNFLIFIFYQKKMPIIC
jgi:hypothetical protein